MKALKDRFNKDILVLDGGMGTQLQAFGLEPGASPELLNLENPELITRVHAGYVAAGTDIVYANTFGANRKKLARINKTPAEIIPAAIKCAKKSGASYIALDLGPIGALIEPLGDLTFEEAVDIFAEQVKVAVSGGKSQSPDLIVIETMTDLYETKAAVLAAKENSDLPVLVTMSFEENGRTFTGTDADSFAITMEALGVDALGLNCSCGPEALAPVIKHLSEICDIPLIIKPNAGLPDPMTGEYDVTPEEFAASIKALLPYGLKFVGGCCGTTPDYIMKTKLAVNEFNEELAAGEVSLIERKPSTISVCSARKTVVIDCPRVIGERINPTGKKRFQEALKAGDMDYVLNQAIAQVEAGAEILDVNVGVPGIDEKETMIKVVKAIQSVVDVPLQIDSSNPEVIAAALRIYNGKPIVNSVNGDESSLKNIIPLIVKYGAAVVGLTLDKNGIAKTAEGRIAIAERIFHYAVKQGVAPKNIFLDCLTMTVATEQAAALETLKALRYCRYELGCQTVLGVSNISFGLPMREQVTTNFLMMALTYGLTLPIINPNIEAIMATVRSYRVLANIDKNSAEYVSVYADYQPKNVIAPATKQEVKVETAADGVKVPEAFDGLGAELFHAVISGLKDKGAALTKEILDKYGVGDNDKEKEENLTKTSLGIVNEVLVPSLDEVGGRFEKGKFFLPQLILSASVVQGASDLIKTTMAPYQKEVAAGEEKGVIVATVKGDIHDIGKNIVKILLENYGYKVYDLGKDVQPEVVVKKVKETGVKLVGLSALMTTTLPAMRETIKQIKEAGLDCKTVVGGAVLTPEYAKEINADYYSKDALQTVKVAEEIYGK